MNSPNKKNDYHNDTEYQRLYDQLDPKSIAQLNGLIKSITAEHKYRPKTNIVLKHGDSIGICKVCNNDDAEHWTLFGGGIDGQDIVYALLRELFEETGITTDKVQTIKFLGLSRAKFSYNASKNRDGFTEGQHYFYFSIELDPTFDRNSISLENNVEISWQAANADHISIMRKDRRDALKRALKYAFTQQTPQPSSHE